MCVLSNFLMKLWETGRAEVNCDYRATVDDATEAEAMLIELEEQYRQTLPAGIPEFDVNAASWALLMLYRACQCTACREIEVQECMEMLKHPAAPSRANAATHYSVDVVFQHLPDVIERAKSVAERDPILDSLAEGCRVWPLSSVGLNHVFRIDGEQELLNSSIDLEVLATNRGLMTMYLNRIVERQDRSRAAHPLVQAKFREMAGVYEDLITEWTNHEQP